MARYRHRNYAISMVAYRYEPFPPMTTGQSFTASAFLHRYQQTPPGLRAELLEGVVTVRMGTGAPHADAHAFFVMWLGMFQARNPGWKVMVQPTVVLPGENVVEPDVALLEKGRTHGEHGYLEGAPTLVVEIAHSTLHRDLYKKKAIYRRAGLPIYLVWDVSSQKLHWFELQDSRRYRRIPLRDGIWKSKHLPELSLAESCVPDIAALLR